ncbi:hypothetical protein [Curtobacterium sp. B8]|uniref:hypothetical protein n=1 Tax=Curtobacterium sp. B8 TaxID=95611 RepID=UPI000346B9AC|nr:hypothetical protein [Curtobacterium sp. B8]
MEKALISAVIAAAAAICAAVVSWFGAFQSRRAADREHAWRRFVWSIGDQRSKAEYDISIAVLRELEHVAWWSKSDRGLATRALRRVTPPDERYDDREEHR